MRKICLEEHWYHPSNRNIRERLEKRGETDSTSFAHPEYTKVFSPKMATDGMETYRLAEMNKSGVDVQVISNTYPGIQGILDAQEAIDQARQVNDELAEIIQNHPTRFKAFASLPLQDPKAAVAELERTVRTYGFKGALINGHTNGEYMDEEKFWIVWECASALHVPLYLHPFDPISDQVKVYHGYRAMQGPSWSWNVETATHAMRVVYSSVFDTFPNATLVLGHMGETLPYLLGRIDEGYRLTGAEKTWKIKNNPSHYIKKNIMVTTSGRWQPESLVCAISALGADRVMFSVDYPFVDLDVSVRMVEDTPINANDKEKIFYANAEKLLGL